MQNCSHQFPLGYSSSVWLSMRPMTQTFLLQCYHQLKQIQRWASGTVQRERKREMKKQVEIQYTSNTAEPVSRVYVWGHAATGALGIRTYMKPEKRQQVIIKQKRPARLKFLDDNHITACDVSCGYGFTVFTVKKNRHYYVMATGINTDSQLGYHEYPKKSGRVLDYIVEPVSVDIPQGSEEKSDRKTPVKVACGRAHSVFITNHGVFAQGNNAYGQCGRPAVEGEIFNKFSNIQQVNDLPDNVIKAVCGMDHTLFLTETGEVFSCGLGADGQTGLETFGAVGYPKQVKGDIGGVKIVDIASKADCVLALSDTGDIFGWGNSEYGQLSMVTEQTQVNVPRFLPTAHCGNVRKVAAGGSICALLNDKGCVYVWGYGLLGKGPNVDIIHKPELLPAPLFGCNELNPGIHVTDIKSGMNHFAAITNTGDLYTWGKGKYGSLGLNKNFEQSFPLKVAVPALVHFVDCGVDHTVALCRSFT